MSRSSPACADTIAGSTPGIPPITELSGNAA